MLKGEYLYVIDNINKNMTRCHHSIELENSMFNGTMRIAFQVGPLLDHHIEEMRKRQLSGVTTFSILPGQSTMKAVTKGYQTQVLEILRSLRRETVAKRAPQDATKLDWRPLELAAYDSKSTDEMIKILVELVEMSPKDKPVM